jgi:hypothetical protein
LVFTSKAIKPEIKKQNMKIKIEEVAHLSPDQLAIVELVSYSWAKTLEEFYNETRAQLSNSWFVYRGSNHVALHLKSGDDRRCLIATE